MLCWRPAGSTDAGIMVDIRRMAYKNELKDEPDLVFLQEVPVSEENDETYHIDEAIYGTIWGSGKPYNVILYKKETFSWICSEDVETRVEQAYTNIASKLICTGYISMAMKRGDITVDSEKEAVTRKVTEILRESKLEPLPELIANIQNVWEDTDLRMDRDRIRYLAGCIKRAGTNEYDQIKALLDERATMAFLQVRDSPEEKILAVCYHGPQHSPENERALHLLLQVIKEMCRLLDGCPVLLAGDFNMELWNEEGWLKDYLLSDYKPRSYAPTKHREKAKCIDHILLWDDGQRDYTCSLEDVKPKMIDITDDIKAKYKDQDENIKLNICIAVPIKTDDQTDWENISDGEKPAKSATIHKHLAEKKIKNKLSLHENADFWKVALNTASNTLINWPTKPDDRTDWEKTHDGDKPAKLAKMQKCLVEKVAEEEIRKEISLHDPLRATLQVTRGGAIKTETM